MGIKLGKVTKNDPLKRLALSVHSSTLADLEQYRAFYHQEFNEEISMSLLVEEMAKRFMREDKGFQKFLAAQRNSTASKTGDR